MEKLEKRVRVLALIFSSAVGCTWSEVPAVNSPKIKPISYPEVYCYSVSERENEGENCTICEYDVNGDGKVERIEKEIRDCNNNCLKRLTDYGVDGTYEKEESFVYDNGRSLIKYIVKEGSKTSVHEYADGRIKRDIYDSDSDGNFETIFIHNEDGTISYIGDENDDGLPDVRSDDVNADYANNFDPDGNQGIAYQRILKLSRDLDLNGKFDRTDFIFIKPGGGITTELILSDKNQSGNVNRINKKEYGSNGDLVLEKFDWNGDKKWDSIWKPDTGWVDLN